MTGRRRFLGAGLAAFLATGCDKFLPGTTTPFNAVDITGSDLGPDFRLTDHDGKERTLADFRGKVVALFFGYTYCPDVCPVTLSDLAKAVIALGADGPRVQVLFVTLDPKRDSAELLRGYVTAFNPTFLGLRGDAAATAKVTRDFKIFSAERPGKTPDSYTVDHSAQTLVFDTRGRLRLMIPYGTSGDKIASDLKLLLNG